MDQNTAKTRKIEKTAYHEAGHAVMAFIVRRAFKYVSIEPDDESLGHVIYQKFRNNFQPEVLDENKVRPLLEKAILTGLSGHAAERIFSDRNNWIGSNSDWQRAVDYAWYICGNTKEIEAYLGWLWIRCRNILQGPYNWVAVQALAKELLKKQRIGYKATREIIKEAQENLLKEKTGVDSRDLFKSFKKKGA